MVTRMMTAPEMGANADLDMSKPSFSGMVTGSLSGLRGGHDGHDDGEADAGDGHLVEEGDAAHNLPVRLFEFAEDGQRLDDGGLHIREVEHAVDGHVGDHRGDGGGGGRALDDEPEDERGQDAGRDVALEVLYVFKDAAHAFIGEDGRDHAAAMTKITVIARPVKTSVASEASLRR